MGRKPVEMSFMDVYLLSVLALVFCFFIIYCLPRRRPVQRGRRVSHGATLESAEQPVQSQAQLHHLIDGSVSEPLPNALINPQNRHYAAFTAIDRLTRALTGAV